MSTLKTINLQHPSASTPAITLDSNGTMGDASFTNYPGRNKIINGSFSIWQRGTSFTTSTYTADRWKVFNITSASRSVDVPLNQGFPYSLSFANTLASFPLVDQYIESLNSISLIGKQVTLSFWAKNVSGTATMYIELFAPTTVDAFPSVNYVGGTPYNFGLPSSNWTKYSFTTNNLPSTVANGLQVRIVRANQSAASTLITGVQLETGSVATPFEFKSYGQELRECQRYYYRMSGGDSYRGFAVGAAETTTNVQGYVSVPVTMRIAPTSVESASIRLALGAGGGSASSVAISGNQNSAQVPVISVTGTGLTTNAFYRVIADNSTSSYLAVSAEL